MEVRTFPASQLEFGKLIGEGGFADVYKGKLDGRDVAIKKFKLSFLNDHELEDFYNEAKILFKANHPSIVRLLGICDEPKNICLVLEYLPQGSLDFLLQNPKIELPWIRSITTIARYS